MIAKNIAKNRSLLLQSICSLLLVTAVTVSCSAAARIRVATAPTKPLLAKVYDPHWPESDCSYHGVYVTPEGKIFCTFSSHSVLASARIYQFDPETDKLVEFCTPRTVTPDNGYVPQGKIHSPLGEYKGELIFATHTSHYIKSHLQPDGKTTDKPYKGGYVYAVNLKTGVGRVVAAPLQNRPIVYPSDGGVPLDGEGLVATVLDAKRGQLYVLSWPSAFFARVDLDTGKTTEYGKMQDGAEAVPQYLPVDTASDGKIAKKKINPHYQQVGRTLALDDEGNVYGAAGDGKIWKYDRATDKIVTMKSRSDDATASKATAWKKLAPWTNSWRTIVWDDTEKVFYGVHWGTSWLFRFDPKADTIEPVISWAPAGRRVKDYAQLGLSMGPNRVLYGLVHTQPAKKDVQRSVHLLTLDLKNGRFKDQGPVVGANGMVAMFTESCAVAANGDVYSTCWMEIPRSEYAETKRRRRDGGVPEVKYMFRMALICIPAKHIDLE